MFTSQFSKRHKLDKGNCDCASIVWLHEQIQAKDCMISKFHAENLINVLRRNNLYS